MTPRYTIERLESRQLLSTGAADLDVDLEPAGRTDAAEMSVAADEASVGQLSVTLGGIGGPQAVSYSDVDGTPSRSRSKLDRQTRLAPWS